MMHNLLLQNLETAATELGTIPLWGPLPSFPLENFATALSETFEVEPIHLKLFKTDVLEHPLEGMGETPLIRPFVLSPLPGEFFFVMGKHTLPNLAAALLFKEGKNNGFSEETLLQGFAEVALLNACQTFNQLNPFGNNLSAVFADDAPLPKGGTLCIDVTITLGSQSLTARIVAPSECLSAFRSYFAMTPPPFAVDETNAMLPIPLSLEAGSALLAASEWKSAKQGDCLLLDRCTINLEENKGTGILSVAGGPLFDVRIKGGAAKILDYAMTQKENAMIDETPELPQDNPSEEPLAESEAKPLAADHIPLTLTVELDRFQMPLKKVSELKPGNVLELHKNTRGTNVHLTISGKRVATGELVTIGETIGVKILKLGD